MVDDAGSNPTAGAGQGVPHVLVVEDSGLIAAKITQALDKNGYKAVGPVATLAAALDVVERTGGTLDAALLDIDLRGEAVYPLAEALRARGVPFLFLTGYERLAIPEAWRATPRVEKPFEAAALLGVLALLLAGGGLPQTVASSITGGFPAPSSELDHRAIAAIRTSRGLVMERRILAEKAATQRQET